MLRAFASTNGDYTRTATIVGMSPAEVRGEISSLLNGAISDVSGSIAAGAVTNGAQRSTRPPESAPTAGKAAKAPVKSAAAPAKSKAKRR